MRSSLLLASTLAIGALAVPPIRPKVNVVTETEIVYLTVTVYVTVDATPPVCVSTTPLPPQVPRPINSVKTPVGYPFAQSVKTPVASPPAPIPKPIDPVKTPIASPPAPTPKPINPVKTPVATPQVVPALKSSPVAQAPKIPSSKPPPAPIPTPKPQPQPKPSTPQLPPLPVSTAPALPPQAPFIDHPSGPKQAYLFSGPEYQDAVLYHHNAARANHRADPLVWDRECEANALIAARRCTFQHYIPPGARQGQNLFTVSGDAFNVTAGITESWYKGELAAMMPWFGRPDVPDDVFHDVGHLTQLVWKETTKVGCVSIDCGNFMMVGGQVSSMNKYTVCNYAPAGNMGGDFARNVAAPISLANLGGWAD